MCPVQTVTHVSGRSQCFREFSSESERNFTCNSSPVKWVGGSLAALYAAIFAVPQPKIASDPTQYSDHPTS